MTTTVRTRTRVRYPETDRMGVAHHTHYLVWFELGRTEWMRERGATYGELEDREGVFFPVVELRAKYRASARYDELVTIDTTLSRLGGVRVRFDYEIRSADGGELLATGHTEHASVGRDGKPRRLPDALRRVLSGGAP